LITETTIENQWTFRLVLIRLLRKAFLFLEQIVRNRLSRYSSEPEKAIIVPDVPVGFDFDIWAVLW
jgi:hypothetical protein